MTICSVILAPAPVEELRLDEWPSHDLAAQVAYMRVLVTGAEHEPDMVVYNAVFPVGELLPRTQHVRSSCSPDVWFSPHAKSAFRRLLHQQALQALYARPGTYPVELMHSLSRVWDTVEMINQPAFMPLQERLSWNSLRLSNIIGFNDTQSALHAWHSLGSMFMRNNIPLTSS